MTVRLIDKAGRVVRRAAVGEAATTAEIEEAMDYLLAMAWAATHVRRRGPPRGEQDPD